MAHKIGAVVRTRGLCIHDREQLSVAAIVVVVAIVVAVVVWWWYQNANVVSPRNQ